jgi:hypothetical protein
MTFKCSESPAESFPLVSGLYLRSDAPNTGLCCAGLAVRGLCEAASWFGICASLRLRKVIITVLRLL